MNSRPTTRSLYAIAALLPAGIATCQATLRCEGREDKEKLVVLPFAIDGMTSDQNRILHQHFEQRLQESQNFELLPEHLFRNALAAAGLERIDSCTSLPCLAQLEKVLNVQKVVHVQGMQDSGTLFRYGS